MKIEKAIEILKEQKLFTPLGQAAVVAISALEKQIPKKPIRKSWSISKCPACDKNLGEWLEDGYHLDWDNLKICECGQKLDWEVENE